MKKFAYLAALVVLCAGTVVCAGPASKKSAPPVAAPVKTASPSYTLTIADSDGFSQTVTVGETDTFAVETALGDKTYNVSGDTRPEKGTTMLNLQFNRTTTTIHTSGLPVKRTNALTTVIALAPNSKATPVGGSSSSTDSNGVKAEYRVTASLAFAPTK